MKKYIILTTILLTLATTAAGQGFSFIPTRALNGTSSRLSNYLEADHYTLFVFWKACCPNTLAMLSELDEIEADHEKDKMPLKIVLISVDDARSLSRVRPIIGSNGYTWDVILDSNQAISRSMNITTPPQWVLFDSKQQELFRCKIASGSATTAIYYNQVINIIKEQHYGN